MQGNGLDNFTMHSDDEVQGPTIAALNAESADTARSLDTETRTLDPETAARRYLNQMIASPQVPSLTAPESGDVGAEYRTIGAETVPLTGARIVKFAQCHHRIPVYGSLVTIELDEENSLLAVSSALGDPDGVDPVATVSPADAQSVIREDAGDAALPLAEPPRLYYYFDKAAEGGRWRLVYIAKDVRHESNGSPQAAKPPVPELLDYVVDAHSGELVARLSRSQTVTWSADEADAVDGLGAIRHIRIQRDGNGSRRLNDQVRNIQTFDFGMRKLEPRFQELPGQPVDNPPEWSGGAVSAHANAMEVAEFLVTVLRRNGLDNMGEPFVSSVNCTSIRQPSPNGEWRNAAWIGSQMVYGQRIVDNELRSYAVAKDVVAHEIIHGLTDRTARLDYESESGALNESYSDIFGIIIANQHEPDVANWDWEMGEELNSTGLPLRDMSDPTKRNQPAHMNDFVVLPTDQDHGGVHTNSGIHNKAAFNLITSKDARGGFVFTAGECAALFYLALTQFLSRTSGFADSRRGVELAARTLFRSDPRDVKATKLVAVATAFDNVGIAA
ncbi:M4 family metallopeptidase [Rhodococcus olei]|uniref:Neutral metalloproteinase n=1 Tax=Rhodococcus olei TaxID=2161675 RepID=A0ABP8PQU0_9NOCA